MFELHAPPDMTAPVLIVAFDGWVSAGSVGTTAADHLAGEGAVVASFLPERLYDFRVSRPTATFRDGLLEKIEWPVLTIRHQSIEDRDLLILSGPEPNWNWPELASSVANLCATFGVVEQISLGGIPWAAAHTRPTEVVTTASQPDLLGADANAPGLSAEASKHPSAISETRLDATLTSRNVIVMLGTSADRIAKLPDPSQPPRAQGSHAAGARTAPFL